MNLRSRNSLTVWFARQKTNTGDLLTCRRISSITFILQTARFIWLCSVLAGGWHAYWTLDLVGFYVSMLSRPVTWQPLPTIVVQVHTKFWWPEIMEKEIWLVLFRPVGPCIVLSKWPILRWLLVINWISEIFLFTWTKTGTRNKLSIDRVCMLANMSFVPMNLGWPGYPYSTKCYIKQNCFSVVTWCLRKPNIMHKC